ncbi:amino acid-binding ACT domain-containing protein [Fibrella sp. WM1]|uniref:amino acid-binding ACT domain-containing protein n=1 Tax=Fibrella musci TaxID=3242485 RepID=UPI0035204263
MKDLEIYLPNQVGSLALLGETLGEHQISLEGGAVFTDGQQATAHFLVEEADRARAVLEAVGIEVVRINDVIIQKLRQDVPGQLGMFCRRLADAGVSILTQYSDHANQLIIVVDDMAKARQVSEAWMQEWW